MNYELLYKLAIEENDKLRSEITNLYQEGSIVDEDGKSVTIVGTDGKVYVDGESQITVTVTNYSDTADISAATIADYTEYQVEKPTFS